MARKLTNVQPPLAGLNRAWGYQSQPPFTVADALNSRCRDVFEQRQRLGGRGGHVKAYPQKIGESAGVESFSITVYPEKDAYLDFDLNNSPHGGATSCAGSPCGIRVGRFTSGTKWRSIFHFDVSEIPAGANITSAVMYLTSSSSQPGGGTACKVNRLTTVAEGGHADDWVEDECTWDRASDASAWATVGGGSDYTTDGELDWTMTSAVGVMTQEISIGPLIQDAVDERSGQLHFVLKNASETVNNTYRFFKDVHFNTGLDPVPSRPHITISYETGGASSGVATEVRLLNVCRSLNLDETITVFEPFDDSPLDPTLWTHPSWTLDSVASSGLPTQSGGNALSATANQLRTARLASTHTASTAALREIQLDTRNLTTGNEFSILMDMDNTTPVPAASIRLRGKVASATQYELYLYINEVQVAQSIDKSATAGDYHGLRLRIDAAGTIKGYWRKFNNPSITYTPSGYTAAGGRAGFALKAGSMTAYSSQFEFMYLLAAAGGLPPRALCASANGVFRREDTNGDMIIVNDGASDPTLASDRLLSSVNRLQKLYIADYELKAEGTDGTTSTTTFDSASFSDWTAITTGTDVIVNGTFAADTDWTKGSGWTIGAGVATATGAISTDLSQTVDPLTIGQRYRVVFTITRTAGSITVNLGGTAGTARSATDTFTEDLVCTTSEIFKFSTSGFTGTVDNVTCTPILLRVDADDDRLEIFSGTAAQQGVYEISSVSASGVTLSTSPGNASGISFRIIRAPKVYDAVTDALTKVPIGTIGATPGQFPHGCTIVSAWLDRLIWSGDPRNKHAVFASKRGDPENYKYANKTAGEAFAYDPAQFAGASQIGDAVTAIIPYSDDYIMFAGERSISIQRGDPTYNGELDLVTRVAGIIDKQAWTYLPDGRVLGLSTDGLYIFTPGPNMMPELVSRERIPEELIDINTALYDVQLQYDLGPQGAKIFVTPKEAGQTTHWWFDWTKKAFWPENYPSDMGPTASCVHSPGGSGREIIILGGRDGYLRKEVDSATTDDGISITSFTLLGPFNMGHPRFDGLIHEVLCEVAKGSGHVVVEVLVAETPQEAYAAEAAFTFTFSPDNPHVMEEARARGGACFLKVYPAGSTGWAIETLAFDKEVVGRLRSG